MERFELWERALIDTAAQWDHLAQVLEESRSETAAWSPALSGLSAAVGDELGVWAAAATRWADGLRGLVDDVRGTDAHVVADLERVVRRMLP